MEVFRPSQNTVEIFDDVLAKATEGGSLQLDAVSLAEQEKVVSWFLHNFASIESYQQIAFLEESMQHALLPDVQVVALLRQLPHEACAQLGAFIIDVLEPGQYIHTFRHCWPTLSFDKQQQAMQLCTMEHPEAFAQVALFTSGNNVCVVKKGEKETEGMILNEYYAGVTDAIPLFESMLDYLDLYVDAKKGKEEKSDELHAVDDVLDQDPAENIKRYIKKYCTEYYLGEQVLLYLYPRLQAHNLLEDSQIKEKLFNPDMPICRNSNQTKHELDEIRKGLLEVGVGAIDEWLHISPARNVPRKDALAYVHKDAKDKVRSTQYAFKNFVAYKDAIDNPRDFIQTYLYEGWPVFTEVAQLGLTKKEVFSILEQAREEHDAPSMVSNYDDIKALIAFNTEHAGGPDIESLLCDWFVDRIREYAYRDQFVEELVVQLPTVEALFASEHAARIRLVLTKERPDLLLFNVEYATRVLDVPLAQIVSSPQIELSSLIDFHAQIVYTAAQENYSEQEKNELFAAIQAQIVKQVKQNPAVLFDSDLQTLHTIISVEERERIIKDAISVPMNGVLFRSMIDSSYIQTYKAELHAVAISDNDLLKDNCHYDVVGLYTPFITPLELRQLLIDNIADIETDYLLKEKFLDWWPESEYEILLQALADVHDVAGIHQLYKYAQAKIDVNHSEASESVGIKESRKRQKLRNTLHVLRNRNPQLDHKKIDELQKQISVFQEELKVIKKERLEKVVTSSISAEVSLAEKSIAAMDALCEANSGYVFKDGVVDVLHERALSYVERDVESCISQDYSVFGVGYKTSDLDRSRRPVNKNLLQAAIGVERTEALAKEHMRAMVFGEQRYPGSSSVSYWKFPSGISSICKATDPFEIAAELEDKKDYYTDLLGVVSEYAFYPIFENRLEHIKQMQHERFGQQKKPAPVREFTESIRIIALLEHTPLAKRFYEDIAVLSPKEQMGVIDIFSSAALMNVDREIVDEKLGFDEVLVQLSDLVRSRTFEKLGVSKVEQRSELATLPLKTVRAMGQYSQSLQGDTKAHTSFQRLCMGLSSQSYADWRVAAATESEVATADIRLTHLKDTGVIPSMITLDQFELWDSSQTMSLDEILSLELPDFQRGIADILALAKADQHVPEDVLGSNLSEAVANYEKLVAPLETISKKLRIYSEQVKAIKKAKKSGVSSDEMSEADQREYEQLKQAVGEYRLNNGEAIDMAKAVVCLHALSQIRVEELKSATLIRKFTTSLQDVHALVQKTIVAEYPLFAQDYERVVGLLEDAQQALFGEQKISKQQLVLTDEADFETIFNIGELPVASCQSYNSTIGYNQGLLSYISDPNVRIVQVQAENGGIIARCVLRLLQDKEGKPALFTERVYSVNPHHKIREAIARFATTKGNALGVPVYTQESITTGMSSIAGAEVVPELFSHGSLVPYVYTDAGGGLKQNGIYSVTPFAKIAVKKEKGDV